MLNHKTIPHMGQHSDQKNLRGNSITPKYGDFQRDNVTKNQRVNFQDRRRSQQNSNKTSSSNQTKINEQTFLQSNISNAAKPARSGSKEGDFLDVVETIIDIK